MLLATVCKGSRERKHHDALEIDQGLKRFQRLKGSFEANRARLDVVLDCGLRHDRPDEIVGEYVRPNFLDGG